MMNKYKNREYGEPLERLIEIIAETDKKSLESKRIQELYDVIEKQSGIFMCRTKAENRVCREIGQKLAQEKISEIQRWIDINSLIWEQYEIYEAWIEALPLEQINKYKRELLKVLPGHSLEYMERWGYGEKEEKESFDYYNKKNKSSARDIWGYIILSIGHNSEYRLKEELNFKNDIIKKMGNLEWAKWVMRLPCIQMKASVLFKLKDTSEVLEILRAIGSDKTLCGEIYEEFIGLLINHYIYLCQYGRKENCLELECQMNELVETIYLRVGEAGQNVTIYSLRYLNNRRGDKVSDELRQSIINTLIKYQLPVNEVLQTLLEGEITFEKLLNSLLIFFQVESLMDDKRKEYVEIFLQEYERLLKNKFYYATPLHRYPDDNTFAWLMAGVLSEQISTEDKYQYLVEKILMSDQGWDCNKDKYYESIRPMIHVLLIGTMAVEWIIKEDNTVAFNLYNKIWDFTHRWIREISYHPEEIGELIGQLWARLSLFYGIKDMKIEDKVVGAIQGMDDLSHVLIGCNSLLINLKKQETSYQYNETVKKEIKEKINLMLPIEKLKHSVTKEKLQWYLNVRDKCL